MDARPLDPAEEAVWRSFIRLVVMIPRALEADFEKSGQIAFSEYLVLMWLSEAPQRQLRMSQLATRTALSASRITRVVDDLVRQGLVTREPAPGDRRGTVSTLTTLGLQRLEANYPEHLASVRTRFIDHLTPGDAGLIAPILERLNEAIDRPEQPAV